MSVFETPNEVLRFLDHIQPVTDISLWRHHDPNDLMEHDSKRFATRWDKTHFATVAINQMENYVAWEMVIEVLQGTIHPIETVVLVRDQRENNFLIFEVGKDAMHGILGPFDDLDEILENLTMQLQTRYASTYLTLDFGYLPEEEHPYGASLEEYREWVKRVRTPVDEE